MWAQSPVSICWVSGILVVRLEYRPPGRLCYITHLASKNSCKHWFRDLSCWWRGNEQNVYNVLGSVTTVKVGNWKGKWTSALMMRSQNPILLFWDLLKWKPDDCCNIGLYMSRNLELEHAERHIACFVGQENTDWSTFKVFNTHIRHRYTRSWIQALPGTIDMVGVID